MPTWRKPKDGVTKPVENIHEILAPLLTEEGSAPLNLPDPREGHNILVSESSEQNVINAHKNEDRTVFFKSADAGKSSLPPFTIIGVLDGHDRAVAAEFVARRVGQRVLEHIEATKDIEKSFVSAFASLEDELNKTGTTSGCCVLINLLCGSYCWCANLGDCRAVYVPLPVDGNPSEVLWLSRDMKATKPYEQQRIRSCGGRVIDGRCGGLEPTRTIGDFDVKEALPPGCISITPEVRGSKLSGKDGTTAGIIVMCSDGIWDVMSGSDVRGIISARIKELRQLVASCPPGATFTGSGVLKDISHDLVCFSVARESADDCTALVALVTPPR